MTGAGIAHILIGLGHTNISIAMGVLRIWLLRYLFILATQHVLGVYAVFWGNQFSNYLSAIITTVMVLRVPWVSFIDRGPGLFPGIRRRLIQRAAKP